MQSARDYFVHGHQARFAMLTKLNAVLRWGALIAIGVTAAPLALAGDVWSDPFPGIRYLHRSTSEPKEIHALVIDLTNPAIFLRATRGDERHRTVSSFSSLVGAAAAVNGDFYNTDGSYDPVGLAIGEGMQWADGPDSAGHSFVACSATKQCTIDTSGSAVAADPNWWSAVGGNIVIVNNGVTWTSSDDAACGTFCTTQHPRTAAGLSADGGTLILVVVEGRQSPILGMTLARLATLMAELGASTALNLDGGGSSAMVVNGSRVSGRPDNEPSERAVANHLAVIYNAGASTSGRLVGYVREGDIYNTAAPIAGASIALSTGQTATTNESGFYEFAQVAVGAVTVTASKTGFATVSEVKEIAPGITNWKSLALVAASAADAGTPAVDAAVPASDASPVPPLVDAGVPVDAGTGDAVTGDGAATGGAGDAGDPEIDPDTDQTAFAGGCSALATPASLLALLLLTGVLARRRRARCFS